jgi:RHS repeat-associated protein
VPYHLRVQTEDQVGNQAEWTTLFTLLYDGEPPLITDLAPPTGSVITDAWPLISASLSDPTPGSGVQPLSTTFILDSQVVTPQVNTAEGFAYTPTQRLEDGPHSVMAQVYDQAGNQAQTGPWSFSVDTDVAPSLGVTKYYYFAAQRVAMSQEGVVYFIHTDHLGSTSLTTDQNGAVFAESRYLPYGEQRWPAVDTQPTAFGFTGQRREGFGLMDYRARFYDPRLGRFVSADSVLPEPGNPQALNRYSYVLGNALRFTDPTGHQCAEGDMPCLGSQVVRGAWI